MVRDRTFWPIFGAILLLAAGLRWAAFSMYDFVHDDEVVQYLEQAHRIVFGYGLVPWEARYGARGALMPYLLAGPMALGGALSPDGPLPLIVTRLAYAALCLLAVPAAYALGRLQSRTHGLVAMFVAAIWYESVMFGVQVLSESAATALACLGTAALLRAAEPGRDDARRMALLAGFLLALTMVIRLPYAAYVGPLVLLTARLDRKLWRDLVLGGLPALGLGAAADLAAGMTPFGWIAGGFSQNILQDKAAVFGTSGPFEYLKFINVRLFPAAIPIVAAALLAPARYRPVLVAIAANIVAHSLIGHKEYRFVWLSVFLILVLAAIASVDLAGRFAPCRRTAGLVVLGLAWCGLSFITYSLTGGMRTFRSGGYLIEPAVAAARMPGTCGIGLAAKGEYLAYVFVRRPIPVYDLPEAMLTGREGLPAPVSHAANALVLSQKAAPPLGWRRAECRSEGADRACLYLRDGGCSDQAAAAAYTYQATMLRNGM